MSHNRSPGYQAGNHWVECQVCGFDYRHDQMRLRWDNLIVCPKDFETRQPQDFVRAREDRITPGGLINPPTSTDSTVDKSSASTVPLGTSCLSINGAFYVEGSYWPDDYVDDSKEGCPGI